ncbi:MAG: 2-oxoglutarate dehydrogenase complex dihydrolipoyllysine-residue succinyltransferase [Bacteroidales bacterium]|nr:2-oxoglutarate dehydrogenase complex dihydrolipoyllysine-residue succinyltransferase [Bacteroidales bacterium]
MVTEVKVPSPGESINEVQLAGWLVEDGSFVEQNQDIAEIDSDKATLSIAAEISGIIRLKASVGDTINVGSIIALIEAAEGDALTVKKSDASKSSIPVAEAKPVLKITEANSTPKTVPGESSKPQEKIQLQVSPLARKLMEAQNMSDADLFDLMKHIRLGKKDIQFLGEQRNSLSTAKTIVAEKPIEWGGTRNSERKKVSMLRKKLSERLVSVKNETAMLTTFNEVNMSAIMEIRKKFKDEFKAKHEVGLGFMSFFTKAVTEALRLFPQVNSQLDGDEIVTFDYADISIAVSGPKGLVVPVIRNAETLSLAQIELAVKELAVKARDNKLSLEEMSGGTFTITNGGIFGSMLSTPIINPPQSAILGMHNIVERPVAINGKVEIHPVMYVALSYDHRIIDGRESVGFLVKVKEMLEDPLKMMFGSKDPHEALLDL